MVAFLVVSIGLVLHRMPRLRQEGGFESFVSREFAFLLNNWVLLAMAFFVLFVTMMPTITEGEMWGERITIGPGFFNRWMTPLGLVLLFLAGAAPLLAWRRTTRERLYAQFLWPGATAVGTVVLLARAGAGDPRPDPDLRRRAAPHRLGAAAQLRPVRVRVRLDRARFVRGAQARKSADRLRRHDLAHRPRAAQAPPLRRLTSSTCRSRSCSSASPARRGRR
ncbi:MAG: hypothetical protein HS111_03050 [Kofleriaceae bacterium]|nr:hypothetical protein [Kofleriaceae bacterium]